jgi:hypothetical protein
MHQAPARNKEESRKGQSSNGGRIPNHTSVTSLERVRHNRFDYEARQVRVASTCTQLKPPAKLASVACASGGEFTETPPTSNLNSPVESDPPRLDLKEFFTEMVMFTSNLFICNNLRFYTRTHYKLFLSENLAVSPNSAKPTNPAGHVATYSLIVCYVQ